MSLLAHWRSAPKSSDVHAPRSGEIELSSLSQEQSRTLARIRAFAPRADVHLHGKPGGVLVELRRGHSAQVAFIDDAGTFVPDRSVRPAY